MMKPRVLMIAYACDPQGSGEHWLGWGWAEQAARGYEVELITTPKARAAVEASSKGHGITPHFVEVPPGLRKLTELWGGAWLRKLAWQTRVAQVAAVRHRQKPFSLVHQTTFHTFRAPFRAASLGIPAVWGPIAGGEHVPAGFERYLGSARLPELSRQLINRLWLKLPSIQRSLGEATVIFVSNHTTLDFLPPNIRAKCQVVPPNALRPEDERYSRPTAWRETPGSAPFRLLYVGNCVATRAIPIVLEALQQSGLSDYEFTIVGAGPAIPAWQKRAGELGLQDKVKFAGRVPYAQLSDYYARADVLVFPALRDSGGSALLEAMARFLPVICLDWAGPGEMVDGQSGIKIPVTTPVATVRAFSEALVKLERDTALRERLGKAGRARAEALFRWEAKRALLEATYQRLIRLQPPGQAD